MQWDPGQYGKFGDHRQRPFFDLLARVRADSPRAVVDLGSGPGNLTAVLAGRWPGARVTGLDSSADMVQAAEEHAAGLGNLGFERGDIASWHPGADTDVVVSNAALQWVPGHRSLLARWVDELAAGAWVGLQVPGNFAAPSHALLRAVAGDRRWSAKLQGVLSHEEVGEPEDYLGILLDGGCTADAWETTYLQLLPGTDPVLEWVRGAALRPVFEVLDDAERAAFESEYRERLRDAYPPSAHGTVYPFRRIFAVGRRNG
ncbi:trans-aconitate 2-methyltransferase [Paenarthrobacter sp. DKR-5]|uniref:trans-aconitate 2-methyltransferase n=1 Tax=Paenarthrobacter sp. DKR-5 TaxID=2835535 RepID=UPI001BDC5747|nr:trans-aconitate 2-methyltransferase [Paenarthrobacter sp. DKR-5]MBT1001895.1 trans-aconitate 2-methyltransferase [Paenarthrobacter sp. DKR-5]